MWIHLVLVQYKHCRRYSNWPQLGCCSSMWGRHGQGDGRHVICIVAISRLRHSNHCGQTRLISFFMTLKTHAPIPSLLFPFACLTTGSLALPNTIVSSTCKPLGNWWVINKRVTLPWIIVGRVKLNVCNQPQSRLLLKSLPHQWNPNP